MLHSIRWNGYRTQNTKHKINTIRNCYKQINYLSLKYELWGMYKIWGFYLEVGVSQIVWLQIKRLPQHKCKGCTDSWILVGISDSINYFHLFVMQLVSNWLVWSLKSKMKQKNRFTALMLNSRQRNTRNVFLHTA